MRSALIALLLLTPWAASAHVVPDDVRVQVFLRPEPGRMTILVRVPANALIDILFPVLPGTDSLDLKQIDGFVRAGAQVWIADLLTLYEEGHVLPPPRIVTSRIASIGPIGDLSFNLQAPRLPPDTLLSQDDAAVDAVLEIPIRSVNSRFSFEPRFGRLGVRVTTALTFLPPHGGVRQYTYEGDPPTFDLNPGWQRAIALFVKSGFARILNATDDLLFLFCLALAPAMLNRRFLAAFVAAQACALICTSEGWMPSTPKFALLTATLAAAAVVYLAIGIIISSQKLPALAAGLIFGANSWLTLAPIVQFGGAHRLLSTLSFSCGLALAQLAILLLLAFVPRAPRTAVIIAAAIALHVSWHRMIDSAHTLGRFL